MTKLLFGFRTHKGPREVNEDTVLSIELPDGRWLVAVADGMGGLAKGELAGKTALGALYRHLSEGAGLVAAMREANAAVFKESQSQELGTTLVAALLSGTQAEIANVGDSRAYHFDPLGLVQVTRDHTIGEEAAREGSVTEEELASMTWAEALSRYLGGKEEVEVDHFGPLEIQEGGWLLLCSDGLHKVVSADELERFLNGESDPKIAVERLVELALEKKTGDNVSVALVYCPKDVGVIGSRGSSGGTPTAWNPERFLSDPKRSWKRKKRRPLAIIIPLVLIPLLVGIVVALRWWLSIRAN